MRPALLLYFFPRRGHAKSRCGSLDRPSRMPSLSLDECKPAKPIVNVKPILDLKFSPVPLWNFDGACLSRKVTGLCLEFAVELWQHPKKPIQISHNYSARLIRFALGGEKQFRLSGGKVKEMTWSVVPFGR